MAFWKPFLAAGGAPVPERAGMTPGLLFFFINDNI